MSYVNWIRTLIVAAVVVLLELLCRVGVIRTGLMVPPTEMVLELYELVQNSEFWAQVFISAKSIVIAFVSAIVVGCLVALVLHALPRIRDSLEPLIASYYALPFFVLYPLLIVLLGMNQTPIILIGFLYAVMAVVIGTMNGLDRIPAVLFRTGRVCQLSPTQQALFISLPAAAPYLFTGAKLAFGYSITGVLGSEFILSTSGLGYQISFAYNNFEDHRMYALLLFLLTVVSALTILMYRAQKSVQHRSGPANDKDGGAQTSVWSRALAGLVVVLIILATWKFATLFVSGEALAGPEATFAQLWQLLQTERFWGHIGETGTALGLAIIVSCVFGTILGVLLGLNPTSSEVSEPMLVTLYSMPKVTLYPVVLLFVGVGLGSKVVFGAMYGMIPMTLLAMNAIRSMNPALRKSARVMRLSRVQTITTIILPATVPEIVTGIRVSFSITLLGVMIGEMFASVRGLGHLIMNSINVNDTATMMAVTILIAVFAVSVNTGLIALDRAIHHK
ncbi:ABC transporter permease [Pacificispira sp.]|uniref:ABC transporter permease n=1 Tax=Pacificispira sp. TaxID=2888761 RepID=UPI003B51E1C5